MCFNVFIIIIIYYYYHLKSPFPDFGVEVAGNCKLSFQEKRKRLITFKLLALFIYYKLVDDMWS